MSASAVQPCPDAPSISVCSKPRHPVPNQAQHACRAPHRLPSWMSGSDLPARSGARSTAIMRPECNLLSPGGTRGPIVYPPAPPAE